MNVSGASSPAAAVPTVRPTRRKDVDGDYDGPPKPAAAAGPTTMKAAVGPAAAGPVVVDGKVDTHA